MHEEAAGGLELTPEILAEFAGESEAQLSKAESAFLAMEAGHGGNEALNSAFRSFHTLKGTADYLGFKALKDLAHFCEELLDRARSDGQAPGRSILSWLIRTVDEIRAMIRPGPGGRSGYNKEEFEAASGKFLEILSSGIISDMNFTGQEGAGATVDYFGGSAAEARPLLKVDAYKFGAMMNSLNELAVAETVIRKEFEAAVPEDDGRYEAIKSKINALGRVAAKLNYDSFALKMLPFQHLFDRMTRLIRDLSIKSGKKIKLLLSGGDTEIDREIIENLAEPLIHIMRNSVDHGIENPSERAGSGKPEAGLVSLSAYCRDGNIIISASDDGRGLDREKILSKAEASGFIRAGEQPDDEKIFGLIMLPGFTTAERVSELSGRGVGMDSVRKAVESLRGHMKISSVKGQGTKITMTFPVNMAVIEGLTVICCGETYIVPASNIGSVEKSDAAGLERMTRDGEIINGRLCGGEGNERLGMNRIIINIEGRGIRKALAVERIISQQKVAVKNIPGLRLEGTLFSGAAILPDGKPALIISPERLADGRA